MAAWPTGAEVPGYGGALRRRRSFSGLGSDVGGTGEHRLAPLDWRGFPAILCGTLKTRVENRSLAYLTAFLCSTLCGTRSEAPALPSMVPWTGNLFPET